MNSKRPTLTLGKKRSDPNAPKLTVTLNSPKPEIKPGSSRVRAQVSTEKKFKGEPLPVGVNGKMEINIKFNQLPNNVLIIRNAWRQFLVQAEQQQIKIRVRPRSWNKMLAAETNWEKWTASITGKMGNPTKGGFELITPAVQIYEKKDKNSEKSAPDNTD